MTYDLKSGEPLDLGKEFEVVTATGTLSKGFFPVFKKHVLSARTDKWEEEPTFADCYGPGDEDGYGPGDEDAENPGYRTQLALTDKGLKVRTDFERRIEVVCEAEAIVPYGELARFRRKDSRYRF